jgi:hypothetical protein
LNTGSGSVAEAAPLRERSSGPDAVGAQHVHVGPPMHAAPLARARAVLAVSRGSAHIDVPATMSAQGTVPRDVNAGATATAEPTRRTDAFPLAARVLSPATTPVDAPVPDTVRRSPRAPQISAPAEVRPAEIPVERGAVPATPQARHRGSPTIAASRSEPVSSDRSPAPSPALFVQRSTAARGGLTTPVAPPATLIGSSTANADAPMVNAPRRAVEPPRTSAPEQALAPLIRMRGLRPTHSAPTRDVAEQGPGAGPLLHPHSATVVVQRATGDATSAAEMVWRRTRPSSENGARTETDGSPLPTAGRRTVATIPAPSSTIARSPASNTGPNAPDSVTAPGAHRPPKRRSEGSQLVEQVTRRLLRQIAVERERRGGGRWP